jgi:hypothetical protein
MTTEAEVEHFLKDFQQKLRVFEILFRDERNKNLQTLANLDITRNMRRKIVEQLERQDYSEGPLDDNLYGMASMWVFGKVVKQQEVYIKISMGQPGSNVICISFHIAAMPMKYPFKPTTT